VEIVASRPKIRGSGKISLLANVKISSGAPNSLLLNGCKKGLPLEPENSPHLLPRLIIKLKMNAMLILPRPYACTWHAQGQI
jgi:hypothetical protein